MKLLTLALLCLSILPAQMHAATNFECLPDNTVFNVRVPNGADLAAALKPTKLMGLFNSQERWDKIVALIESNEPGAFDEFTKTIAAFNLKADDLPKLLQGETGLAVALHAADTAGAEPAFTLFVYFEAEAELGDRLAAALDQAILMNQADPDAIKRSDFQVGEHDVVELNIDGGDAIVYMHRDAGAYVFAITEERGLEATQQSFASFLDARAAGGDENGFAKAVMGTSGLADGIPAGATAVQMTFNPQVLIDLIPEEDGAAGAPAWNSEAVKKALALDGLRPAIIQGSIEGDKMHQYAFMGLKKPLAGVLRLLDFPELSPAPAAWVPNTVLGYGHYAIDLQAIYDVVTETAIAIAGPMIEMKIDQINQMPMMIVGTDLKTFLGTFGKRIVVMDLGKKYPENAEGGMGGTFSDRIAIVWEMNDTTAIQQAMPMLQQQAAALGGMAADEQGATGIRFNMSMMQPGLEGGFFVTNDQLLIAAGVGVTEQMLSAIQAPPAAADTLLATEAYARAQALLPPRSGFVWAIQDVDKGMSNAIDVMHKDFKGLAVMNPAIGMFLPLLPSVEEVKGVFGVGTSHGIKTEHGLLLEGVVELGLSE